MTAIAAYTQDGHVWMAGDGVGYGEDGSYQRRRDPKVFVTGEFAFGVSNSFRLGQLIRHQFTPPPLPAAGVSAGYMVREFVPALSKLVSGSEMRTDDVTSPFPGQLLTGVRGRLFEIQSDYQVAEPDQNYWAIGSASDLCFGALSALLDPLSWTLNNIAMPFAGDFDPESIAAILARVLKIASDYHVTAGPPFTLVTV